MYRTPQTARTPVAILALAALSLLGWPRTGWAADWADTRVSGPFVCRADFSLKGFEPLLGELGQLQTDLVRSLAIPPAKEPIELYLFRDQQTYAQYLKRHLPNVPYRRALYVKGKGPGMVFAHQSKQFAVDLRHECTHALLHAVLPSVPLWLDEGLAAYFEPPAKQRAFDSEHLAGVRWNARLGITPRLADLEKKGDMADMTRDDYRAAWTWVHFMLHGSPAGHAELVRYLADLRAQKPPAALSTRLAERLSDPAALLAGHFREWKR
jgi:hypothetical protein